MVATPPRSITLCLLLLLVCGQRISGAEPIDVDRVWSGHPVGFSLLTHPPHQFVAYYDADRQMTIAQRLLAEPNWTRTKLPSHVGWDSHNSVTMAIDRDGYLHVAGNMHCVPLIYFRSAQPMNAASLERVVNMVDPEIERRVTYPVFFKRGDGQLVFRYRNGRSGSGDDIYNVYEESKRGWRSLLNGPLTSGHGQMNAYCSRPTLGPDGRYHMVWVWRDTPDCATNHDLSYARSRDLELWETAGGISLQLPITVASGAVVDAVPPGGGLINGGHALGFDTSQRPVITYHKYDQQGNTQVYAARYQEGTWEIRQVSEWTGYRWAFQGGGSISSEVHVGPIQSAGDGRLRMTYAYPRGRGTWMLDEATLRPQPKEEIPGDAERAASTPDQRPQAKPSMAVPSAVPGLQLRSTGDLGSSGQPGVSFRLQWYTLGPNRDRPREGALPPPTLLQVICDE
jgi:hypothetical protein